MKAANHQMGPWLAAALVVGNMVGSGIFLLPTTLAPFGYWSIAGWLVSGGGALVLAVLFGRLSRIFPLHGGIYRYTQRTFGDFWGFVVAYGYWIAIWVGNAAIAVAFVSSLTPFFPIIKKDPSWATGLGLLSVWSVTAINLRGVGTAARWQMFTIVLRLAPVALLLVVGWPHFAWENLQPTPGSTVSLGTILTTAALTMWSFLGVESATIPAGQIRDPARNIPRATLGGTLFAALVMGLTCTMVMGLLPPAELATSAAPFADAAAHYLGPWGYWVVGAAAAISCWGALSGWVLLQGQIPLAAAHDGLFPAFFAHQNRHGAPVYGLVLSSVLMSVLILFNFTRSLQQQYAQMILLATLANLLPYAFCAVAEWRWAGLQRQRRSPGLLFLSLLALLVVVGAMAGAGWSTLAAGLGLLATGIPLYWWQQRRKTR